MAPSLFCISLNVGDLERSEAFYREALGFRKPECGENALPWTQSYLDGIARLSVLEYGEQSVELVECRTRGALYPAGSTACDLWFQHFAIVTDDMKASYARLQRFGVIAISRNGPERLPMASGGVEAYKFRDPDGHPLELIRFPACHAARRAAAGIDHTAISVGDVEQSIAFYRALGLRVSSRHLNTGSEQERLDDLPGAEVDVVALEAAPGPHVELLGYRQPRGRRRSHIGCHDISDTKLLFRSDGLTNAIAGTAGSRLSPQAALRSQAALLRDPDGHAIVLFEPTDGKPRR